MKKLLTCLTLCFSLAFDSSLYAGAMPMPKTQGAPSVHDMFKDVPQDELLAMMEEGQQFIKYLEEHGTPEEKMAFAQAMEETLQGFSEDDWKEFEQIVETVQDKLPPMDMEPKYEPAPTVPARKIEPTKEVKAVDNSIEKLLKDINSAIASILLKAKSDIVLSERITMSWKHKDEFNEMNRLIQALNKKEHIQKLSSSKEEAIKTLVEILQNFNKRLQVENDNFIIADTFGLQADEATTAANLKKLNKIIEFFDSGIELLTPKIKKFFEEYEPEALKIAQNNDKAAKDALDSASRIEKQRRPNTVQQGYDRSPSNGSRKDMGGRGQAHGGSTKATQQVPGYLEQVHKDNLKNVKRPVKSGDLKNQNGSGSGQDQQKQDRKKTGFEKAIDNLDTYLDINGNTQVASYMNTINNAGNLYKSFGTPIDEDHTERAKKLLEKQTTTPLHQEEESFLKKFNEQYMLADKNFAKNTQHAHSFYAELKESIENISSQIDEMMQTINATKSTLDMLSSKELEKLQSSSQLKTFEQRIHSYHVTFKNAQRELHKKHKLHRLERQNPREEQSYEELAAKINSLHGLDTKISNAKSQCESLQKAIKSALARKKREENKAAAQ